MSSSTRSGPGSQSDSQAPQAPQAPQARADGGIRSSWATVTDALQEINALPAPIQVYLVIVGQDSSGRVVDLPDASEVSFGRSPDETVTIDDARISRRHAVIRRCGGDVFLKDLGSRNGTKVGDTTLKGQEQLVAAGDKIKLGPIEVIIAAVTLGGAKPAPAPERRQAHKVKEEDADPFDGIIVADPAMQKVFRLARRLGQTPTTVLILGETGAGKEIVAEQIHRWSPRAKGPLVRLNCASLPETLLEGELFGHEKGAFTGADRRKIGFIEAAHGGTLFLDEIGEMTLATQVKLLRVLESRAIVRLGDTKEIPVDARVICLTHRNLKADVASGRFREDLYYRITTFTLSVPPLRERPAEITLFAELFAVHCARRMGVAAPTLDPGMASVLLKHRWPGNVRELRNAIEHAVVLAEEGTVREEHLPDSVRRPSLGLPLDPAMGVRGMREKLVQLEKSTVEQALLAEGWNQTQAAKKLGITRRMLIYKMSKLGIRRPPA